MTIVPRSIGDARGLMALLRPARRATPALGRALAPAARGYAVRAAVCTEIGAKLAYQTDWQLPPLRPEQVEPALAHGSPTLSASVPPLSARHTARRSLHISDRTPARDAGACARGRRWR